MHLRVSSQAISHAEQHLLSSSWCLWRRRMLDGLEEKESLSLAKEHCRRRLLRAAFHLWTENVQEIKEG